MHKQTPNRSNRSKGIKVKHILQICVLIAVCFWLLYQVKHSDDKRKEFESKDDKIMGKLQSDNSELQRFGRKDIPRVTDIATNIEKHEEDDDDVDKDEKEDEEDKEYKTEEDEIEKEDSGVGDDEIDEHEPEKTEEEDVDEDKEREENHNENDEHEDANEEVHLEEEEEEESGKEGRSESEENDDIDKVDHGEREITSDDHDDHDQKVERNTRKAQEELYRGDDASSEVTHSVESINQENNNFTFGQANEIYGKINFGNDHETNTSEVSSLQNSTLPQIPSNSTVVGDKLDNSLFSNGTQKMTFDANLSQNGTIESKQTMDDANKSENVNTNKTLASSDDTNGNVTTKNEKDMLEGDETEDKKPEYSGSMSSEGKEAIQQDPIDVSDIKNEVHDTRDEMAE